jgi:hypothetical protein
VKNRRALSAAKCPSPRDALPRRAPVTNADGMAGGHLIKPAARGPRPSHPILGGSLMFQFKVNILDKRLAKPEAAREPGRLPPVFLLPQEVDRAHSTLRGSGPSPQILQLSLRKAFFWPHQRVTSCPCS